MPPSITETQAGHSSLCSSKKREKGSKSSSKRGAWPASCNKTIFCPITETTYEGQTIIVPPQSLSPSSTGTHQGAPSSSSYISSTQDSLIKHGKGTIHNHNECTTLAGYFQNNQIIGHALQTFYDQRYRTAIAFYEGSFCTSQVKETSHSTSLIELETNRRHYEANHYLRHGFGKYTWPMSGDEYVGEFHLGTMQGIGTFIWSSTNERYEGPWFKNKMHGSNGMKHSSTGDVFTGTFIKGKATGWGSKEFVCGDHHHGMYRKDKRHGLGMYRWRNGDQYFGQWYHGRMVGRGIKSLVYTQERGEHNRRAAGEEIQHVNRKCETYHGSFVNEKANGYGVKIFACGDVYVGQYRNDKRHIYGVYTWENGDEYNGQFVEGQMFGIGIKRMANGDIYDGDFQNDEGHGFGVKTFRSTGDIHIGEYRKNDRHGPGLYRWSNGDEYEGEYVKGEQCGFGVYRWSNGTSYHGRWKSGQKHGPGYLKYTHRYVADDTRIADIEMVFFEVWDKGNRLHRQFVETTWDDLPEIEDLPIFQTWQWVWDSTHNVSRNNIINGATSDIENDGVSEDSSNNNENPSYTSMNNHEDEEEDEYDDDLSYTSLVGGLSQNDGEKCCSFSSCLSDCGSSVVHPRKCHSRIVPRNGVFVVVAAIRKKARRTRILSL